MVILKTKISLVNVVEHVSHGDVCFAEIRTPRATTAAAWKISKLRPVRRDDQAWESCRDIGSCTVQSLRQLRGDPAASQVSRDLHVTSPESNLGQW